MLPLVSADRMLSPTSAAVQRRLARDSGLVASGTSLVPPTVAAATNTTSMPSDVTAQAGGTIPRSWQSGRAI
jgi:hypothetical protein